jgi:hypothetical protein
MSMLCKKCGESFDTNRPFEVFEFRRPKLLPDSDGMTHADTLEDGGAFCSPKCLTDYLSAADMSGVFDLTALRKKLKEEGKM